MTSLYKSSTCLKSEPKCLHSSFSNEKKEPERRSKWKMNNKDFLLSFAAGRGSKPRFKLSRLKQFSSARRTLLVAAKAMFLGRWSSGFARAIDCEKASDWCCSMNQKPIASCEFLLWESQQTFSSSVYCCEFTASIALHNFGFSFESLLRSP